MWYGTAACLLGDMACHVREGAPCATGGVACHRLQLQLAAAFALLKLGFHFHLI
ncbi:hypothetical protein SESBI_01346 [Sesbania bispinosa]|nr:hypothetical protein SESBI_01346 [Sesbania bispinosa]